MRLAASCLHTSDCLDYAILLTAIFSSWIASYQKEDGTFLTISEPKIFLRLFTNGLLLSQAMIFFLKSSMLKRSCRVEFLDEGRLHVARVAVVRDARDHEVFVVDEVSEAGDLLV